MNILIYQHYNDATLRLERIKALVQQIENITEGNAEPVSQQATVLASIASNEIKSAYAELDKLWNELSRKKAA